MRPVAKGFWLAIANVFVIAFALSCEFHPRGSEHVMSLVVMYAIFPAIIVGTVLGGIAEATAARRPLWRFAVLAVPAWGLVVLLANVFDMRQFELHACIPTFVAVSILERSTRKRELVPIAFIE